MKKTTGSKGSRTTGRAGKVTNATVTEPEVSLSEPQELVEFPLREGRVWSRVEVNRSVRDARELFKEADRDAGRRMWRIGDKLLELYNGFPERAKGFPSFIAFATAAFDHSEREIREVLRVRRRLPNADAATGIGRSKLRLGFRLLDKLGLETFETLRQRDLPLPDGTTCRFPGAPRRQLASALMLMVGQRSATAPSKKLRGEVRARNEQLRLARTEDPDLASVKARYVLGDGEPLLKAGPLNRDQALALARFVMKVER